MAEMEVYFTWSVFTAILCTLVSNYTKDFLTDWAQYRIQEDFSGKMHRQIQICSILTTGSSYLSLDNPGRIATHIPVALSMMANFAWVINEYSYS